MSSEHRTARALDAWRRDDYRWQTLALALPTAACAGIGMLAFTTWLYTQTGEWFLWMKAHGAWGRQFSGVHLLAQQRWRDLRNMGVYGYSVAHAVEIGVLTDDSGAEPVLRGMFGYSPDLVRVETVSALADEWVAALRALAGHASDEDAGGFTPSDLTLDDLDQSEIDDFALEFG